jgi:hypothetical protein
MPKSNVDLRTKTIMFIDSNDIDNFIGEKIIKHYFNPKNILVYRDHINALTFLGSNREKCPDYIFLSSSLPGLGTSDFLRKFENLFHNLKIRPRIILLAVIAVYPTIEEIKKHGKISGIIEKPITKEKLSGYFKAK